MDYNSIYGVLDSVKNYVGSHPGYLAVGVPAILILSCTASLARDFRLKGTLEKESKLEEEARQ
jgi:hypothetical protein